jgi:hypothetical protein
LYKKYTRGEEMRKEKSINPLRLGKSLANGKYFKTNFL